MTIAGICELVLETEDVGCLLAEEEDQGDGAGEGVPALAEDGYGA